MSVELRPGKALSNPGRGRVSVCSGPGRSTRADSLSSRGIRDLLPACQDYTFVTVIFL